jgi:threonine synthase
VSTDDRVVVLATGSGLKDVASAMKAVGERPTVVEPTLEAVKRVFG